MKYASKSMKRVLALILSLILVMGPMNVGEVFALADEAQSAVLDLPEEQNTILPESESGAAPAALPSEGSSEPEGVVQESAPASEPAESVAQGSEPVV